MLCYLVLCLRWWWGIERWVSHQHLKQDDTYTPPITHGCVARCNTIPTPCSVLDEPFHAIHVYNKASTARKCLQKENFQQTTTYFMFLWWLFSHLNASRLQVRCSLEFPPTNEPNISARVSSAAPEAWVCGTGTVHLADIWPPLNPVVHGLHLCKIKICWKQTFQTSCTSCFNKQAQYGFHLLTLSTLRVWDATKQLFKFKAWEWFLVLQSWGVPPHILFFFVDKGIYG